MISRLTFWNRIHLTDHPALYLDAVPGVRTITFWGVHYLVEEKVGELTRRWLIPQIAAVAEVDELPLGEEVFLCTKCGFEAASASGLESHKRSKMCFEHLKNTERARNVVSNEKGS